MKKVDLRAIRNFQFLFVKSEITGILITCDRGISQNQSS